MNSHTSLTNFIVAVNELGIDSYAWIVIILTFGFLGMFLEKFKEYAFWKCFILGVVIASLAAILIK
ncbi:hypothetical protein [Metasolibacillus sp.]|uniref:hypothetical protein n=1 Tax=Metasolibacillus sp. TaxID=2703680 RepID=UPI0025DA3F1A|nr:hypothetical protein [Metasolibacillus sp.]MCT6922792.1 hypothetical protein [Metasolibacillus sp.]MCT6938869.1 hypothetical protein [Metasolibacillus sp.]